MDEAVLLNGDNAYNAHFGECISAIGDIDDDGYQGQIVLTIRFFMIIFEKGVLIILAAGHHARTCSPSPSHLGTI